MHGILWVLGLITAAAGFLAIGFGIVPSALNFGNTLIIAGATAVVGGFILIGLAAAVHQLKRIADAGHLHQTEMMPTRAPMTDLNDPRSSFLHSQINQGLAPSTPPPVSRAAPLPEPKVAVAPAAEPDPIEWLRPKDKEPTLGERAVIEEFEASLAPQPAPPPIPQPASPPLRPASVTNLPRMPEARSWPSAGPSEPGPQPNMPHPAPERAPSGLFDAVWPEVRPGRTAETVERVRKAEPSAPARDQEAKSANTSGDGQAATSDEARPVAILKSGMIDGMAYTLFADGSIEAVLPTGTLRFASVDALRLHLEKNA